MKIQYFCTRWGADDTPWPAFARKVRAAGYDGIEGVFPWGDPKAAHEAVKAVQGEGLAHICQQVDLQAADFPGRKKEYGERLELWAELKPVLINAQTGKDWYDPAWNRELIALARQISTRTGVPILHETHRGRFSYSAAVTATFLRDDPQLRLVADFSHWCNVSESLLEDQEDALALAISRTDHLHTRVGHAQGPQVNDPRSPEWKEAVEAHLRWWDRVVEAHRGADTAVLTVTPEFGAVPYMPTVPFTVQPLTSQWEVNLHMLRLLKARWE